MKRLFFRFLKETGFHKKALESKAVRVKSRKYGEKTAIIDRTAQISIAFNSWLMKLWNERMSTARHWAGSWGTHNKGDVNKWLREFSTIER